MLGNLAYWLFTGHPPFEEDSDLALIQDHLNKEPLPPSSIGGKEILPEMDALILRCLCKDPQERFQNIQELTVALEGVPAGSPWTPALAQKLSQRIVWAGRIKPPFKIRFAFYWRVEIKGFLVPNS